jgi:4-amino-4-deoxy-L-arabinose transferase-like glycosyltransferase
MRVADYVLLAAFAFLLFGYSLIGGRPLTVHEARIPQSAREMLVRGDWLVPTFGGRPWLERPPLPHWLSMAVAGITNRSDRIWVYRLTPALLGTFIVMTVAWMAASQYGRTIGLLSGLILATMVEFAKYARLAEEDIFLCAIVTGAMAVFAKLEIFSNAAERRQHLAGRRDSLVLVFFLLLGLTNLVKGPLFGTVMALSPAGVFLILAGSRERLRRYAWPWGWTLWLVFLMAWPAALSWRYQDAPAAWAADVIDRVTGKANTFAEPVWYYGPALLWMTFPWTLAAIAGVGLTAREVLRANQSFERFLWCWALVPPVVFSIPSVKHHHHLLHCLAPWAILAALGLKPLWETFASWLGRCCRPRMQVNAKLALGAFVAGAAGVHCFAHSLFPPGTIKDTKLVHLCRALVPSDSPLFVNLQLGSLDGFHLLFSLDATARPLHNLTFLLDEQIKHPTVHVITRHRDEAHLARYGLAEVLAQSAFSNAEASPEDRLTCFRLHYREGLVRYPAPQRISAMQALGRVPGPYLGPGP